MSSAEVVIVGGGPAGASTAIALARAGRDVLVLERSRFPRDKPCGDCANPGSLEELRRLGVAERLEPLLRPHELRGWYVEAPDGSAFRAEFGRGRSGDAAPQLGWAVRRRDLDRALLNEAERAGARVRFGFRVFDVTRRGKRVCGVVGRSGAYGEETIRASWVVGADGLRSVVRRRLSVKAPQPRVKKIALVGHLAGDWSGSAGFGELRVRDGRCCGFAPLASGAGANITLVVPQAEAKQIGGDARGFLQSALNGFPEVAARLRLAALDPRVMVTGPFDVSVRRPSFAGALLVGDAAGYFDPFTGQGINQALRGARWAAVAIEAALREPRRERRALRWYALQVRRHNAATHGLQRVIDAVISRPALMSAFIRVLSRGESQAARRLLRVTGDLADPVTLLDPRVWLRPPLRATG